MCVSLLSYLQECGFVHAAFTFSHESMLLLGGAAGSSSSSTNSAGVYAGSSAVGAMTAGAAAGLPQVPQLLQPNHQQQQQQPQRASWQRVADKTLPPGALISFLQKGLQYVGIEESLLQQQELGKKLSSSKTTSEDSSSAVEAPSADFSLLSPASIQALTRRNPPILLTVPPAAAAAAMKARLEAEANRSYSSSAQQDDFSRQQAILVSQAVAMSHQLQFQHQSQHQSQQQSQHQSQQQIDQQIDQQQQMNQVTSAVNDSATMRQDGEESSFGSANNKRSASGPKRSVKKQKTAKSVDAAGKANATFSSLEQAMAQLEAAKKKLSKRAASSDNDNSSEFAMESTTFAAHAAEQSSGPLPYLINGLIGDNHQHRGFAHNTNGKQHDENGIDVDRGGAGPRKIRVGGGGSFSSVADDDDDDDYGRIPSPPSEEGEEDSLAAKPEEVLKLDKHQSEVFMCAWNPVYTNLIATGSGDASARIWEMNDKYAKAGLKECTELPHGIETGDRKNKDVTTLEWSTDGLLLATGSYDGIARVWDRTGALIHTLRGHQGPIFSLKWNRRGNFLLSGSYDKTIIVWNLTCAPGVDGYGVGDGTNNGYIEHQFKDHEAPALDVDWKDDTTFASCSTDRTVHIYEVNIDAPLKIYKGHTDEVNAVKWSPSGTFLASCSDDCTAKVWEVDSDRTEPLYDFVNHDQEIYTVKWSPTGPGSPNPSKMPLLATASFDGSIRLWNIKDGSCFGYFNQHRDSVYSVAFSPSGDYLASGSLAGQMYIWDVAAAQYVKSYKGKGDIFEVAWNKEETRVAACFSSNVVAVIDFDRTKLPPIVAAPALIVAAAPPPPPPIVMMIEEAPPSYLADASLGS